MCMVLKLEERLQILESLKRNGENVAAMVGGCMAEVQLTSYTT